MMSKLLKIALAISIISSIILPQISNAVYALSNGQKLIFDSGINFFDLDAGYTPTGCVDAFGGATTVGQQTSTDLHTHRLEVDPNSTDPNSGAGNNYQFVWGKFQSPSTEGSAEREIVWAPGHKYEGRKVFVLWSFKPIQGRSPGRMLNFHTHPNWGGWEPDNSNGVSSIALDWFGDTVYDGEPPGMTITLENHDGGKGHYNVIPVSTLDAAMQNGTWIDVQLEINLNTYANGGGVKAWVNGSVNPTVDVKAGTVWPSQTGMYLWEGMYNSSGTNVTNAGEFMAARVGRTLEEATSDTPTEVSVLGSISKFGGGVSYRHIPTGTRNTSTLATSPSTSNSCLQPSCTTSVLGSTNAEMTWNYFRSKGLSDTQTAGIMGNFSQESSFNPKIVEKAYSPPPHLSDTVPPNILPTGQPGYGIAQWTYPARKENLKIFAETDPAGRGASDITLQLDFAYHEMTDASPNDVLEALLAVNDVTQATVTFHNKFEGSNDNASQIQERVNDAKKYFNLYKDSTSSPIVDTTTGSTCSTAGAGQACKTGDTIGWQFEGACKMISYDQGDPKWANIPYGAGKTVISESGCGPTSLAMVGATLLNNSAITPETVATKYGDAYHDPNVGTSWSLFPRYAQDTGLRYSDLGTDFSAAAEILRAGGLVVISVDPGHFTGNGHLMVIRATNPSGTEFYLADPNGDGINNDSETRSFTADFLRTEGGMKHLWGYAK